MSAPPAVGAAIELVAEGLVRNGQVNLLRKAEALDTARVATAMLSELREEEWEKFSDLEAAARTIGSTAFAGRLVQTVRPVDSDEFVAHIEEYGAVGASLRHAIRYLSALYEECRADTMAVAILAERSDQYLWHFKRLESQTHDDQLGHRVAFLETLLGRSHRNDWLERLAASLRGLKEKTTALTSNNQKIRQLVAVVARNDDDSPDRDAPTDEAVRILLDWWAKSVGK